MIELDGLVDLVIDNAKKLFFPEEWIKLDAKFSKFELFTMVFLDKRKELTMTELVEYLGSPMSTATGIVDRLVKNGYVERERSETDRRMVLLCLTQEGTKVVQSLKNLIGGYLDAVSADITEEEMQVLTGVAFKVMRALQAKMGSRAPDERSTETIKKIEIE